MRISKHSCHHSLIRAYSHCDITVDFYDSWRRGLPSKLKLQISEDETPFTYVEGTGKGPRKWGKVNPHWKICGNGKLQSPSDVVDQRVQVFPNLGKLKKDYKPAPATLKNRGHDIAVMPPGMEFNHIVPQDADMVGETEGNEDNPSIWSEIMRFFSNARKPIILALARPDPKKNITTLVKAFGECKPLRELANVTLTMGNRDAIDEMSNTNATVLHSILKLIDKYDLYGHVAYPKHHKQSDVPDIYSLAAKTKSSSSHSLRRWVVMSLIQHHLLVDFCCGANDFSFLMKKKLDETGTRCSYKNYDVLQAKGELKLVGSLQPASHCKEHMIGFAIGMCLELVNRSLPAPSKFAPPSLGNELRSHPRIKPHQL
ncbi:putative sucrose-phosphate synthase 1 [Camellia lanceoleosa]|uniref:Sucrose-phosphate synthase 1 n=1 Tax=Camellia lanceoleosa TaxID=1840588 RepID=A0ACC0G2G1_9ERIC|nr:putative sucrose-phosphate synthase 1 [Camellia lanceoleosa]